MDSEYIIYRLKSTQFKYPTVALLKTRLNNMDEEKKEQVIINLKRQLYAERNLDIQLLLKELIYHFPAAS